MPIELEAAAAPSRPARSSRPRATARPKALPTRERMFFTERLELLLETGVPLHSALDSLEHQVGLPEMQAVVADLRESVAGGLAFSQALAKHPKAFPPTYVNLVGAGEQGGFLPRVLQRLREMDEKREELRSTLLAAFSYPAFLIVFSLAVVLFVLVVVFPKFAEIFEMIWDQLPLTTRLLMGLGEGLRAQWAPVLLGSGAVGFLAWRWLRSPRGRAAVDALLLRLPLLRDISVQYQLVQFMHVMSLSLTHGVALLDALRACREVVSSAAFRRFVRHLETRVEEGQGVASGFQDAPFLPVLVPQMVSTGEESGGLALVMGRIAEFYEREWRRRLTALAKIIEPAMLLVMGVVIGLIVSSLLLPIFKLSTAVR